MSLMKLAFLYRYLYANLLGEAVFEDLQAEHKKELPKELCSRGAAYRFELMTP